MRLPQAFCPPLSQPSWCANTYAVWWAGSDDLQWRRGPAGRTQLLSPRTHALAAIGRSDLEAASADGLFSSLSDLALSPIGPAAFLAAVLAAAAILAVKQDGRSASSADAKRVDGQPYAKYSWPGSVSVDDGSVNGDQEQQEASSQLPTKEAASSARVPPPSSPDSIYLQMRLRLAKQSAEEDAALGTRFVVRFSSQYDAIYENPVNGGSFQLRAGLAYIEEFDSLAGCSALAGALQSIGTDTVEYQVSPSSWRFICISTQSPSISENKVTQSGCDCDFVSNNRVSCMRARTVFSTDFRSSW